MIGNFGFENLNDNTDDTNKNNFVKQKQFICYNVCTFNHEDVKIFVFVQKWWNP